MQFYALEHQLILCHVTCFFLKMFNACWTSTTSILRQPFWKFHLLNAHAGSGSASQDENTEAKTSKKHLDARIISSICRSTAEFSCFKSWNWKLCSFAPVAPVSLFHQMVGKGYPMRFTLYSYHMHGGPANPGLPLVEKYLLIPTFLPSVGKWPNYICKFFGGNLDHPQ